MPRNGNGNYNLPQPAFTPGTTISSTSVNSDFSDIASALTGSVSADGQTAITGQLRFPSGTAAAPAITFASDLTTGMYYIGTGHLGFTAAGTEIVAFNANNLGTGQNGNVIEVNTPGGVVYPCPVGSIIDFGGSSAPAGWFLCFGQSLSATSYPELFQVLGTTYGTSGGNVVLPDCRGRASFGKDDMGGTPANRITVAGGNFAGTTLGASGGTQNQTLNLGQLPVFSQTPTFTGSLSTITGNGQVWFGNTTVNGSGGAAVPAANNFTIGTVTPLGTVSAVTFGSGNAHAIINPAIIFNKIIYAGRP